MSAPSPTPPGSRRAYWACQIGGWYGWATLQVVTVWGMVATALPPEAGELEKVALAQFKAALGENFPLFVAHVFALCTGALLLSHVLHGYIKRHRWADVRFAGKIWRVFLAGLLLSAPVGLIEQFTAARVLRGFDTGTVWLDQLQHAIQWAPLFWGWMIVYFVILNQRRLQLADLHRSELARTLREVELRLLKSQLNPHFLFNSLNSVRALIADDPKRAQDAVTRLARTLRYTLGSGQDDLVTLAQELEIVDDYLGLESLRLAERLRIERDIAPGAMRVRIPVMLLQTVVENAIKHGIAELPDGGELRLSAQVENGALELKVANPRPVAARMRGAEGIGLRNATERLRLLFGAAASLELDLSQPERAITRIRIPAS